MLGCLCAFCCFVILWFLFACVFCLAFVVMCLFVSALLLVCLRLRVQCVCLFVRLLVCVVLCCCHYTVVVCTLTCFIACTSVLYVCQRFAHSATARGTKQQNIMKRKHEQGRSTGAACFSKTEFDSHTGSDNTVQQTNKQQKQWFVEPHNALKWVVVTFLNSGNQVMVL